MTNATTSNTAISRNTVFYIALGIFLLSLVKLGSWSVQDSSEARYAHIGEGMYTSGDYTHPIYLGIEHYHKPPLTFQLTAVGFKIFGKGAFGARFFLQISLLLQLLFIYLVGREILPDKRSAEDAVMIYASFAIAWIATRNLTTDSYLLTTVLASIWALVKFLKNNDYRYLYLLGLFGGIGFLTKITAYFVTMGPVALALMWYYRNHWKATWHIAGGAMVFLAVCSTWFIALGDKGLVVLKYLLYDQSVVRYTEDVYYRNQQFYFYLVLVPALSFPWIIVAMRGMIKDWSSLLKSAVGVLFVAGFLFPVVFYSLSKSKLILYVLAAFPPLAWYCAHAFRALPSGVLRIFRNIALAFSLLLFVGFIGYPYFDPNYQQVIPVIVLSVLGIGLMVYFYKYLPLKDGALAMPMCSIMLVVAMSGWFLQANETSTSSTGYIADWIEQNGLDDRKVYVYDRLVPSINFYTSTEVALISDSPSATKQELHFEEDDDWKSIYYNMDDDADVSRLRTHLDEPAILISRPGHHDRSNFIFEHFENKTQLGKWEVYY